jgi:signal transduction histidine kinase
MKAEVVLEQPVQADDQSYPQLAELAERLTHKLRNPLGVITTAASQLENMAADKFGEEEKPYLQAVLKAADRIEDVLNRFTQFACLRTSQKEKVDLNGLCSAELREVAAEFDNIHFETELDETLPEIGCDPFQVRLILSNIIRNAFQSIRQSGAVRLKTGVTIDAIIVSVTDTGDGIPSNLFKNIFRPFTTSRPGTAGLGLAIAERMARANNGVITVASREEGGAEVALKFPLTRQYEG